MRIISRGFRWSENRENMADSVTSAISQFKDQKKGDYLVPPANRFLQSIGPI
jgi:hypothetical protein